MQGLLFFGRLLVLATLVHFITHQNAVSGQLHAGGNHVCSRTVYYHVYEKRSDRRIGYDNYRMCCKRKWGVCLDRCTRTRSKWVTYYKDVLVTRSKYAYECCSGWARSNSDCSTPICSPGCINGHCVSPNNCRCKNGFHGNICQSDINECSARKPCSQTCTNLPGTYACSCRRGYRKRDSSPTSSSCSDIDECSRKPCSCASDAGGCLSTCVNTIGSFICQCNPGFKLIGGKTCVDVDECASSTSNACEQTCQNTVGSYRCACRRGYLLKSDKSSCYDVNECETLNGGCQQTCVNAIGSFHCQCLPGFRMLPDKRRCQDIDECFTNKHSCDKQHGICSNTRGSYKCGCQNGYALKGDQRSCIDINECLNITTNECAQNCHNTDGAYTCSCRKGFRLNSDGHGCQDIDECKEKLDKCQHICQNTISTYVCKCRKGYVLTKDGYSCRALPCETMVAPKNGKMACNGFVTDKSCSFSCDEGFFLTGSKNRTCLPNSVWAGKTSLCPPKPCPAIDPPLYGSVVLPCVEKFNSSCLMKCNRKHYLTGERLARCIVRNGITEWERGNVTCKAATACKPNPCQHNGKCKDTGFKKFSCDCSKKGYTGRLCEKGVINRPKFPKLIVGERSTLLAFSAQPENEVKITPIVADGAAIFNPPFVRITFPQTQAGFFITTLKVGLLKVKYKISGLNAVNYLALPNDNIYSSFKYKGKVADVKSDFYRFACKTMKSVTCPNKKQIHISSSCSGKTGGGGFVSVLKEVKDIAWNKRNLVLPLSAVGMLSSTSEAIETGDIVEAKDEVDKFLRHTKLIGCQKGKTCPRILINSDSINTVIDSNLFARGFFHELTHIFPFWLRVALDSSQFSFSSDNFRSSFLGGNQLPLKNACRGMMVTNNDFYSVYTPQIKTSIQILSVNQEIEKNTRVCYSVNMCDNFVQIGISKGTLFSMTDIFQSMGFKGLDVSVTRFGVGQSMAKVCSQFGSSDDCLLPDSYWDVSGSWKFASVSAEIFFDGRMFTQFSNIYQFPIEKFVKRQRFLIQGKLTLKMKLKVLGKEIVLTSSSMNSSAKLVVGGPKECLHCKEKGLIITMRSDETIFDSMSTTLHLQASPARPISLQIPMDLQGGQVQGISNKNEVVKKIRLIMKTRLMISRIKLFLGFEFIRVSKLIDSRFKPVKQMISSLYILLKKPNAEYKRLFEEIERLKRFSSDLEVSVRGLMQSLSNNNSKKTALSLLKVLLLKLKTISQIKILPKSKPVAVSLQGYILSYRGKFCIHQLCFENLDFSFYDLYSCKTCGYGMSDKQSKILIEGEANVNVKLSKKLHMMKGQKLKLYFNKTSNTINGKCDITATLNTGQYTGNVTFSQGAISLQIQDVSIVGKLKMNLSKIEKIEDAAWENLSSRMKGSSSRTSKMARAITIQSQLYFEEVSNDTKIRVGRAKRNELVSYKRWQGHARESKRLANLSNIADLQANISSLLLQKEIGRLNKTQFILNSYIPTVASKFIQRNMESMCALSKCQESCISLPYCEICQEPVHVDVVTLECRKVKRTIRTMQTVTFNTKCEIKKYIFIPIYTGSCKEDASMAAYRDSQLKQALVSAGSGIGALIGGPVGAVIGAVVGFFASFFSSCDRSYDVVTKVRPMQVDCVRSKNVTKTLILESSKCLKVDKKVKTGYGAPKDCNCVVDSCFTKVTDSACLIDNEKCHDQRLSALENTTKLPDSKDLQLYKDIQRLKKSVKLQEIITEESKQKKKQLNAEYKRARNLLSHFNYGYEIAKKNHQELKDILKTEICIASHFDKSRSVDGLMYIIDLSTVGQGQSLENKKIVARMFHITDSKTIDIPLIFEVKKFDSSIRLAGKRIIRDVLCPSKERRRRSVNDGTRERDLNVILPFTSWFSDVSSNLTNSELACITVQKSTKFLKEIISKLYLQMVQGESMTEQIAETRFEMEMADSNANGLSDAKNRSAILEANKRAFNSLSNSVDVYEKRNKPAAVINQWLMKSELYTKLNNLTVCSGFVDCVDTALKSIRKLPLISVRSHDQVARYTDRLRNSFDNLLRDSTMKFDELKSMVYEIENTIAQILKNDLHCSKRPTASILPKVENLDVLEGDSVKLTCDVTSNLPVDIFWKFNDEIKDDAIGKELIINTTIFHTGMYTCFAENAIGGSSSDGLVINVNAMPRFIEGPKDFTLINPSIISSQPFFVCNVSATPSADIEWYFIPYGEIHPIKLDYHKSILVLENVTYTSTGEYFCRAINAYGRIQSSNARLDVLQSILASQTMILGFEIKSKSITEINSLSFRDIANNSKIRAKIQANFTIKDIESGILELKIVEDFKGISFESKDAMFQKASKSRQNLVTAMTVILESIIKKNSSILTSEGQVLAVDNESYYSSFIGNVCRDGYVPAQDGYTCYECQAGWYSGLHHKSRRCPVGTFQPRPGAAKCQQCKNSLITEQLGSTSSKHCIDLKTAKTDIAFILDSSRSTGYSNWNKIIQFIVYFVEKHFTENSTRVMLINYGDLIKVPIQLGQYPNKEALLGRLPDVAFMGASFTRTREALQIAYDVLKDKKRKNTKQIVAVFTDGQSTDYWYKSGFQSAREKALQLRSNGIHVISIGVGFSFDTRELNAIASYPKVQNTAIMGNHAELLNNIQKSLNGFFSMNCSSSNLDIGFFADSHSCMMGNERNPWAIIRSAISKLPNPVQSKTKVALLELARRASFEKFDPKSKPDSSACLGFASKVAHHKSHLKAMLQQAYNEDFTELRGSIARVKVLLAFTVLPIGKREMSDIRRRYPEEKIHFFNLLLGNLDDYDDSEVDRVGDETSQNYLISSDQVRILSEKMKSLLVTEECSDTNQ